jgi:hypothetical protein
MFIRYFETAPPVRGLLPAKWSNGPGWPVA